MLKEDEDNFDGVEVLSENGLDLDLGFELGLAEEVVEDQVHVLLFRGIVQYVRDTEGKEIGPRLLLQDVGEEFGLKIVLFNEAELTTALFVD